jgi:hypothetical protein
MADMRIYSNAEVYIYSKVFNGLLTQESSVTVSKKSGMNPVFTSARGLAGASPGAKTVEISIENAIPALDFEMLPDKSILRNEFLEVHVVMAGKTSKHEVFTTEVDFSHSVNDAAKMSIKFMGRFDVFEG